MAQLDSYNYTRMEGTELELPPGFRFHPTDDELVKDYLCRKCAGQKLAVPIIAEIDLYKFDPWELPEMAAYGEKEWYFFSPRDRKYPNGSRPNRAAGNGFWKATGADKPIGKPDPAGIKKALVFYAGKAPRGIKTNWIMHEYRLANVDRSARKNSNLRLDEWVLCRLYNKKGTMERYDDYTMDVRPKALGDSVDLKPNIKMSQPSLVDGPLFQFHSHGPDSGLWSSGSEHVLSPEVTCYKEVQSQPRSKTHDLDNLQFSYIDEYDDTFAMDHLNMFISP